MFKSISNFILIISIFFIVLGSGGVTSEISESFQIQAKNSTSLENSNTLFKNTNNSFSNNSKESNLKPVNIDSLTSMNMVNVQNYFTKSGQANNTLMNVNETFSLQEKNISTNSISFNTSASFSNQIVPSYSGYNLTNGYFNISNVKSALGIDTIDGSKKITKLSVSSYSGVAASFTLNKNSNISSISVYLDETGSVGGGKTFNLSIRSIDPLTHSPNGTLLYKYVDVPYTNNFVNYNNITIASSLYLPKGVYALIIDGTASSSFNFPSILDEVNGNQSFMWTKSSSSNWNLSEYHGDIPFFFKYIEVDSVTKNALNYNDPTNVDFKINNQILNNLITNYSVFSLSNFNITTNTSISYDVNYFLKFDRNSLLNVTSNYNITNDITLLTVDFNISNIATLANPIFERIFILNNIPKSWNYSNAIEINSVIFLPYKVLYDHSAGKFSFTDINPGSNGKFTINFSDLNYADNIVLVDSSLTQFNNLTVTGSNAFHYIGVMSLEPGSSNNAQLILVNSLQTQIINYTNPSLISNWLVFPTVHISDYFPLNSSYQGFYTLKFFWSNNNLTQFAYYEKTIQFVILPNLSILNYPQNYYIGDFVTIKSNFTDSFNNTPYSTATINFTTDWGLTGKLFYNNSTKLYEGSISTFNISIGGDHFIEISTHAPFFANLTNKISINVNLYRPTSLNLISRSGLINNMNNITRLSSNIGLTYNFTNKLNSTLIINSNVSIYLNDKIINPKSNSYGLDLTIGELINISLDLDPIKTLNRAENYNLTIVTEKFGFLKQKDSYYFEVKGYDLSLSIDSNKNFIQGQTYNIKVQVSFTNQSNNYYNKPNSFTSSSFSPNSAFLQSLNINLEVYVTFLNNTKTIYQLSAITDSNGVANFDLNNTQTDNLLQITNLNASFEGNGFNNAISYTKQVNVTNANSVETTSGLVSYDTLIIYASILVLFILVILGSFFLFSRYLRETAEKDQQYKEKIATLTNFLGMYITNKDGLPIFLKSNQQYEDQNQHLMLSGVTYSIDLFLNNFKDEYMRNILKEDNISRTTNTGLVNMTVINQDKFKIVIGVSDNYRLYVLSKETNDESIRIFQETLECVESGVEIRGHHIINLAQIYPIFTNAIQKAFPIELVNEFEVKIPELVEVITNSEKQVDISNSTITKLKEFCLYLVKHTQSNTITIDEDFDFRTIINNSRQIKVETLTLVSLMDIFNKLKCSKEVIHEILFILSQNRYSIFKNITPLSLPDENTGV